MLSSGEAGDAPQGRALLEKMGPQDEAIALLMDRAYEGNETRTLAISLITTLSSRRKAIAANLGNTTKSFTKSATRSNAFFAARTAIAGFSLATTSST
jgi:hypothetical protein